MANPLAILRRHQRGILAACAVVAIIVFTVGSIILDYQQRQTKEGSDADDVVVTWRNGVIRESDVMTFRSSRLLCLRFLAQVINQTLQLKGNPRGIGIQRDARGQITEPGIPATQDSESLVQTMILAEKARKEGFVISDQAIQDFLAMLSNETLSGQDLVDIHRDTIGKHMSSDQMFEHLRVELLAMQARALSRPGTVSLTPAAIWDYHNRLHRRVKAEVLPLRVKDFVEQVNAMPNANEIQTMYDKYKDFFAHPSIPEPGFRRRKLASFQFVRADFEKLRQEEVAKVTPEITDRDIEDYYESNKKSEFQIKETPSSTDASDKEQPEKPQPEPETKQPETKQPEQPTADKPDADKPDADKPDADKPDARKSESEKSGTGQQGNRILDLDSRFVSFNPQETKEAPSTVEEKPAPSPTTGAQTPATTTSEKSESANEKPESTVPDQSTPPAVAEPKYKPLDDTLKEEIRGKIARQRGAAPAQQRLTNAFAAVRREVQEYGRKMSRWKALSKTQNSEPKPPDLNVEQLAAANGIEYGSLPLIDAVAVEDHDIGKSTRLVFEEGVRQISFAEIAFGQSLPLYSPEQISTQLDREYLFWKTDEKPDVVPTMDEAKADVIAAWKQKEAQEIVKKEAEKLVAESKGKNQPLKELFDGKNGRTVSETQEFSWLSSGALGFGNSTPSISAVENVEVPGQELMQAIFSLGVGDVGYAFNHAKSVAYVFKILSDGPDVDTRRKNFMESHINFQTFHIALMEAERVYADWYRDLEKEYSVEWNKSASSLRMR